MGTRKGIVRRNYEKVINDDRKWIWRYANTTKHLIEEYTFKICENRWPLCWVETKGNGWREIVFKLAWSWHQKKNSRFREG